MESHDSDFSSDRTTSKKFAYLIVGQCFVFVKLSWWVALDVRKSSQTPSHVEFDKHKALTNNQVCKLLGCCSITAEIRIMRLHFLQSMLQDSETHDLYLSTLFGQYIFEDPVSTSYANPWIKQYYEDIKAVSHFDGMCWIWDNLSESLIELVNNSEVREEFIKFDMSELRAQEVCHAICFSNYIESIDSQAQAVAHKDDIMYSCDLCLSSGEQCKAKFNNMRKLVIHQRMAKQHKHAYIHLHSFVITNQCPWCETIFSSQTAAIQHARASMKHDRCIPMLSHFKHKLVPCTHVKCPIPWCDQEFECLLEYYSHINIHVRPPQVQQIHVTNRVESRTSNPHTSHVTNRVKSRTSNPHTDSSDTVPCSPLLHHGSSRRSSYRRLQPHCKEEQISRARSQRGNEQCQTHGNLSQTLLGKRTASTIVEGHRNRVLQDEDGRCVYRSTQASHHRFLRGRKKTKGRGRPQLRGDQGKDWHPVRARLQCYVEGGNRSESDRPCKALRSCATLENTGRMEDNQCTYPTLPCSENVQVRKQEAGNQLPLGAESRARSGSRFSRWINPNMGMGALEVDPEQDIDRLHASGRNCTSRRYGEEGAGISRFNEVNENRAGIPGQLSQTYTEGCHDQPACTGSEIAMDSLGSSSISPPPGLPPPGRFDSYARAFQTASMDSLRKACEDRHIASDGVREVLVARLVKHLNW